MDTTTQAQVYNPFSVAPMLDLTTRHCRHFYRQLSQHALLYTEMVTTGAILHGRGHYLDPSCAQSPVALQLGGNVPEELALCAKKALQHGYVEINLNVGCPSNRVQNGFFGACLMAKPQTVATCVQAMQEASGLPVSVKTRIGIDHEDSYEFLTTFVDALENVGCTKLIVHARKAWLTGLSPKQNRDIPPLDYSRVYQLKHDYPHLHITINGGIKTLQEAQGHLRHVDGVMLGREVYQNPYLLSEVDRLIYARKTPTISRIEVVKKMLPYVEQQCQQGVYLTHITRHMLGLFQGQPGARRWRRYLSEHATQPGAGVDTVLAALALVAHP